MWRIHLLGTTGVCFEERVCEEITSQEALVLGYLALAPKHSLTRSELIELLWYDEIGSEYLAPRLRQMLFNLKKKLRKQFHSDGLLATKQNTIALHPDVTIDSVEFEAAILAAKKADSPTSEEKHLTQAIQLYGGQLLPEQPNLFDDERKRLRGDYQYARKRLAECSAPSGPRLPPIAPSADIAAKAEWSAVPVAPVRRSAKPRRKSHWRATVGLPCFMLLAYMVWASRRSAVVPTVSVEITPANVASVIEELNHLRVGGKTTETPEARNERLQRHAELCVQLLEAAETGFWGLEESIWQNALITTRDSQKMAFDWCREHDTEKALQMSGVLAMHQFRESVKDNDGKTAQIKEEGRQRLETALLRGKDSRSLVKARALRRYIAVTYEDKEIAHNGLPIAYAEESLDICRQNHNEKDEAEALRLLAFATAVCSDQHEGLRQYKQVLETYRRLGNKAGEAQTYLNMASLGGLNLPKPAYWTQNAEWARKSLHLFREAGSQYGIQRAMQQYSKTVKEIESRFAVEKAHWNRWLLEDYCLEAQSAEAMGNTARVVEMRKQILTLASELQDKERAVTQMFWLYRHWNRSRSSVSSEGWARMYGVLLHFEKTSHRPLLSNDEKQELEERKQGYLLIPNLRAEYESGTRLNLNKAAELVSDPPH